MGLYNMTCVTFSILLFNVEESLFLEMWKHMPFITAVLVVGFICAWSAFKFTKFYNRFEKTERDCSHLSNEHKEISNKLTGVDRKLGIIITALVGKGFNSQLFVSHSPIELTDFGKKILVDIGGQKYIDDNLASLIKIMESKSLKTGLDVQNFSNLLLTEKTIEDEFTHVKQYIFQNPVIKGSEDNPFPLDLSVAIQVMSIYLRNKYFEKYPDLKKDL